MAGWPERLGGLAAQELGGGLVLHHARSRAEKRRGLAGLDALGPERGLRLPACRSVHTVGMRFALDLLWLGPEEELVRVDAGVVPRRMRSCLRARSVVEVVAGAAPRWAAVLADASPAARGLARLSDVDTTPR